MNTSGYVDLKYLLSSLKNDLGMHDFDRDDETLLQWFIDGFSELNMFSGEYGVKSVWLTMDSLGRIEFPSDYISYVGVGIAYNGRFWSYGRDGRIISTMDYSCGVGVPNSEHGELVSAQTEPIASFAQEGGWNFNWFKEDRDRREFTFDNINNTEVLLIYRTTGISLEAETTYIARICVPYLKEYCQFKLSRRNNNNYNRATIIDNECRMLSAGKILKKELRKMRFDEITDVINSASKQTFKR